MIKNIQTKIILIFFILEIIFITSISFLTIHDLKNLIEINGENSLNVNIEQTIINVRYATFVFIIFFILITIVLIYFIFKAITVPTNRLIASAEKIAKGEEIELNPENEKESQINDLVKAFGVMTDELKQNLREVGKQKKQIETILLHMTDGIIAFDMEGKIIHENPAAINLLQLEEKERNFSTIFKKLGLNENVEKIAYLENMTTFEQRLNVKDKFINLLFVPFQDENSKPEGIIVVIQDITEHVKLDNMRKEFVADVSHELKTPITSIMGYADTLLESEYDQEMQSKFLNVISSEAKRMAKLVTELLILSRYDNNKEEKEKVEFDLGDLTKKCIEKLQVEIKKKNHKVECYVTANVPKIIADKDGIERVILNIISNSIKYTPENGILKVYVGFVYNDAYIKIIDNGIGIPEEDLSRIFERFYRVDKARTRQMGGTGLGLSIAKEILEKNGGSIDIKSAYGKGTEVVIRLRVKNK